MDCVIMTTAISETIVRKLPIPEKGNKLHYFSGATLQGKKAPSGFAVRVTAAGTKSFVWFHRVNGSPYLETIGRWDQNAKGGNLSVLMAIVKATERVKGIEKKGDDHRPQRTKQLATGATMNVAGMLDDYIARAKKEGKLRSIGDRESAFNRLVKPRIGRLSIYEVRRGQIMDMLDAIADENGEVMSDRTLAYLQAAFTWRAKRDDDLTLPFIRGMARTKPKERARKRTLSDAELRTVWKAADAINVPFAAMVRFLLLTGARRREAARITWDEIDGVDWTLPALRNKTKAELIRPLSKEALAVIKAVPRINSCPFVFSLNGRLPIGGIDKFKRKLDKASGVTGWVLHDLRRSSRSIMSRAGVPSDHAELCLGHVVAGVKGTYDRHDYYGEKKAAFEALAAQIARILDPAADNVKDLAGRRARL
jgi:integrase